MLLKFPIPPHTDRAEMVRQWEWWFRGEGNAEIVEHFSPLLEQAIWCELDTWSDQPRSRLALILVCRPTYPNLFPILEYYPSSSSDEEEKISHYTDITPSTW